MALDIDIRRATDRFHTDIGWLDSWHSFSFAGHFDAENTGHGLLIVCNDDTVAPGGGFSSHAHRDMEIVTWVLAGGLEHEDSEGTSGVIYPGLAQRMSAGTGIVHSEMNHSRTEPVHFVQMWVVPDQRGVAPGYEQRDRNEALAAGGLVPIASGGGLDGAVAVHQRGATFWAARSGPGDELELPAAPFVHLLVATGAVDIDGERLRAGDAARLTSAGAVPLTAAEKSEILVWESNAAARP